MQKEHDIDPAVTDPTRGDLSGEDLSRGPTPETRHPAGHVEGEDFAEGDSAVGETGGVDDVRDTTQGPTPETRQTMRATDDDDAAAGQPGADRGTRADVGGNQDTDLTRPVDPDRRDDAARRDPALDDPALGRNDADLLERDVPGDSTSDPTVR
jgi:hypothetical protein